jgi:signal transduction histidine kinase
VIALYRIVPAALELPGLAKVNEELAREIEQREKAEAEQERLREQMLHAQKLESLGVLAGGIAHDFNNLLTGVMGNASLALEQLPPSERVREYIVHIQSAANRAAELCAQMLAYSGKGRFVSQPINLSILVEDMAKLLRATLPMKHAIRCDLSESLPSVLGDPGQLRQVTLNLITNASEALADEKGVVTIVTGIIDADEAYLKTSYVDDGLPSGRYVFLDIVDDGCGMSAEDVARMFEPFFTTKFTGRGLGLSAVLGIVRSHQGAVRVTSTLGRGTSLRLLFPASPEPAMDLSIPEVSTTLLAGGGTVLVVDDEHAVRSVSRKVLERAGFKVVEARNGYEGLDRLREHVHATRAVVLDMTMPGLNGDEVMRRMLEFNPSLRIILSSGYNEQDLATRYSNLRIAHFIQKPYTAQALVDKLCAALQT